MCVASESTCHLCGGQPPFGQTWDPDPFDGDLLICPECMAAEYVVCDRCGGFERRDEACGIGIVDETWRTDCYDCGETVPLGQLCSTDNGVVCSDCRLNYFTCDGCGRTMHDDAYGYDGLCVSCSEESRGITGLHGYCYKPDPEFHRSGNDPKPFDGRRHRRYFGIELETKGQYDRGADVGDLLAGHTAWYAKEDSSLGDSGAEFVSHPGTWSYWSLTHDWSWLREAEEQGFAAEESCGMHVHVNRASFTHYQLLKLAHFVNATPDMWFAASGRDEDAYDRWAKSENLDHLALKSKVANGGERYSALNMQPSRTAEFRVFAGTTDVGVVLARLALIVLTCEYVTQTGWREVTDKHADRLFRRWVAQHGYRYVGTAYAKRVFSMVAPTGE
jgi:hypothetical protein